MRASVSCAVQTEQRERGPRQSRAEQGKQPTHARQHAVQTSKRSSALQQVRCALSLPQIRCPRGQCGQECHRHPTACGRTRAEGVTKRLCQHAVKRYVHTLASKLHLRRQCWCTANLPEPGEVGLAQPLLRNAIACCYATCGMRMRRAEACITLFPCNASCMHDTPLPQA